MQKLLKTLILISTFTGLAGCYTNKDKMFPHDNQTMKDIFYGSGVLGSQQDLLDSRLLLRREIVTPHDQRDPYSRSAVNEIYSQFQRLPNPDLVMYVFPHLAGAEQAPIPGYSTLFPFYTKVQYAMPGERVEDY